MLLVWAADWSRELISTFSLFGRNDVLSQTGKNA
ncbi:hypothetical protein SLEP1_g33328 [Rubroshorea leprosula]|uniref:Uncharacterized protein n=1 Tax=Rubroshorea leprosula TaxID=152421 RepID=A0AAV5KGB4_9ROSI|nr:hypothetical protein SLEP1_g33328 [Rubroshorea leprosula]